METHDAIKYSTGIVICALIISRIIQYIFLAPQAIAEYLPAMSANEADNWVEELGQAIGMFIIILIVVIPLSIAILVIYVVMAILNMVLKDSKVPATLTIILASFSILLLSRVLFLTLGITGYISIFYIFHLVLSITIIVLCVLSLLY